MVPLPLPPYNGERGLFASCCVGHEHMYMWLEMERGDERGEKWLVGVREFHSGTAWAFWGVFSWSGGEVSDILETILLLECIGILFNCRRIKGR